MVCERKKHRNRDLSFGEIPGFMNSWDVLASKFYKFINIEIPTLLVSALKRDQKSSSLPRVLARRRHIERHLVNKGRRLHALVVGKCQIGAFLWRRQRLAEDYRRVRPKPITVPDPKLALTRIVEWAVEDARRAARRQLRVVLDGCNDHGVVGGCPVGRHRSDLGDLGEAAERPVLVPLDEVRGTRVMSKVARWVSGQDSVRCALLVPVEHPSALALRSIPVVQDLGAHRISGVDGRYGVGHEELLRPYREGKTAVARSEPGDEIAEFRYIGCPLLGGDD